MWRALVIMTALLSLCVSSNVGPRFLPLPPLDSAEAERSPEPQGIALSRSYFSESKSFRVPMMAQAQKRAEREKESRSVILVPGIYVASASSGGVPVEVDAPDEFFIFAVVADPPGRAPPDLT